VTEQAKFNRKFSSNSLALSFQGNHLKVR